MECQAAPCPRPQHVWLVLQPHELSIYDSAIAAVDKDDAARSVFTKPPAIEPHLIHPAE